MSTMRPALKYLPKRSVTYDIEINLFAMLFFRNGNWFQLFKRYKESNYDRKKITKILKSENGNTYLKCSPKYET